MNHFISNKDECEVIIVETKGSTPAKAGARMTVTLAGLVSGTVGGGKIEKRAIEFAQSLIQDRTATAFITWNLQKDLGMTCGGELKLFFEFKNLDVLKLSIFGAGHIAQALAYHLLPLKISIRCFDDRKEWLDKLPNEIDKYYISDWNSWTTEAVIPHSYCVLVTRSSDVDGIVLKKLLSQNNFCHPYLGMIGSKTKALKMKSQLLEQGFDSHFVDKIKCPMGLNFGSHDPHEISLSIIGEIISHRDSLK